MERVARRKLRLLHLYFNSILTEQKSWRCARSHLLVKLEFTVDYRSSMMLDKLVSIGHT